MITEAGGALTRSLRRTAMRLVVAELAKLVVSLDLPKLTARNALASSIASTGEFRSAR